MIPIRTQYWYTALRPAVGCHTSRAKWAVNIMLQGCIPPFPSAPEPSKNVSVDTGSLCGKAAVLGERKKRKTPPVLCSL